MARSPNELLNAHLLQPGTIIIARQTTLISSGYTMKWLGPMLALVDLVPALMWVTIVWALMALLFYKFHSNRWRTSMLALLLVGVTWGTSAEGDWIPSAVSYGVIGLAAGLTEAFYVSSFSETWTYTSPRVLDVPTWLFPMWSLAAFVIVQGYPALVKMVSEGRELIPQGMPGGNKVRELLRR